MLRGMPATLYVVPASHPCVAVERALQLKAIPYRRVDLVPVFHKAFQKAKFRRASTVPGLVLDDGRRLVGSRAILRGLERLAPEPALLPADPDARAEVEAAERWGEEVLQPIGRRLIWTALSRRTDAQLSYTAGAKLFPPVPAPLARLSAGAVGWAERRINGAAEARVREDLAALPAHLDRVESWLAAGVLGGDPLNLGDLQIATSLRLLATLEDLAAVLDRPAGAYARRQFPDYPGRCPAGALPGAWLPVPAAQHP